MHIKYIFEKLNQAQLTRSQVQFSEVWLGRSPRYYSHLIATRRQPGLATLIALEWRLRGRAALMQGPIAAVLNELAQRLRVHIEARGVLDLRRRPPST